MAEKEEPQKPWESSFDDQPKEQLYSRAQTRRKSQRVSMVVGILVAVIIALSFIPVYKYLQELNQPSNNSTTVAALSDNSKSKTKTSKVDLAKQASEKKASIAASKAAISSSKAAAASEKAAAASSKAAAKEAEESSKASSESEADSEAKFASGTLYSFAVSHGTTPENLYALNPGLTASNYTEYYGQELKVK